jgi:hypothetical protein
MAAALSPPASRKLPAQFSLGGMMFVFVLGVSVGLAYWRLPLNTFSEALLASFSTWMVLGIFQRLRRDLDGLRRCQDASREQCAGLMLQIGASIAVIALLVSAAFIFELCRRRFESDALWPGRSWDWRNAAWSIGNVLFFMGIIGAYWSPPIAGSRPSLLWRIVSPFVDVAFISVAAFWAIKAVIDYVPVFQLVHIAIRGVEAHQPIRWAGHPLYPANLHPPTADIFIVPFLVAFACLTTATVANVLILNYWRRGLLWRLVLLCISVPSLAVVIRSLWSWYGTGFHELSPFFAAGLQNYAEGMRSLFTILVIVLGAALAMSLTVVRQSETAAGMPGSRTVPLLHQSLPMIALALFAILCAAVSGIWQVLVRDFAPQLDWIETPTVFWHALKRSLYQYALERPDQMINLAAAVVLARFQWRRWRGLADGSQNWLVLPGHFLAAWLISALTISLMIAIAVWWLFLATLAPLAPFRS